MSVWGAQGAQTLMPWVEFNALVARTKALASGTACTSMEYAPITVTPLTKALRPRWVVTDQDDQLRIDMDPASWKAKLPEGVRSGVTWDADAPAEWRQDVFESLMFPWKFYRFAQDYLVKLQEIQPPADAPLEQRMIWAVDAAWWVNQMLAATNIYPSWFTMTLMTLLDPNFVQGPYVSPERDKELAHVGPFASLGLDSVTDAAPYRVPYATNPGEFNINGYVKYAGPFSTMGYARVKRLVNMQAWLNGFNLEQSKMFELVNKAREKDPTPMGDTGLARALMQHAFFQPDLDGRDFFQTIARIKASPSQLAAFNTAYTKVLPTWVAVMRSIPYWGFVRVGIDVWMRPAMNSPTLATRSDMPEEDWFAPMTRKEIADSRAEWIKGKDEAEGMLIVKGWFNTVSTIINAYLGNYAGAGRSGYDALKTWYTYATFRYAKPKFWQRAWEIHPMFQRQWPGFTECECLYISADPNNIHQPNCSNSVGGTCYSYPDARNFSGGWMQMSAEQSLDTLEQYFPVWLFGDRSTIYDPARVAAFEAPAQPPASQVPGDTVAVDDGAVAPPKSGTGKGVLVAAGAVLLGLGIMFATRGRK